MASLCRLAGGFVRPVLAHKGCLTILSSRTAANWNKNWKPGPYPTTPEERSAAAKKYGLRVEDYEPYPDDGFGFGDYPKLPREPADSRDPNEDWDIRVYRKNYGEPLHVDTDAMLEERWNPKMQYRYSFPVMLSIFGLIIGVFGSIYYITLPYPHFNPVMPKQFPKEGVEHYTFEPAE